MPIIKNNNQRITLTAASNLKISKGEAPKSFLTDGDDFYIVKKPKKRTFGAIFKENFPLELVSYSQWTIGEFHAKKESLPASILEQLAPYALHLNDLLFEAAFGEVLYQQIAKSLFASFESTDSYLHVDVDTREPSIISKYRPDFNEFMEKKLCAALGQNKKHARDWDKEELPSRDVLDFDDNENYLLGKLYAVALLTNDWDLVNNIMLSNAGCVGDSGTATQIMVVDGGNKFHFGFDGLTCDETAFENQTFNPSSNKTHPLLGYDHTLPFDKCVLLQLPRLLVPNLFELTIPKLRQGFNDGVNEADRALRLNPHCITQAINSVEQQITLDSHQSTFECFRNKNVAEINCKYYYSRTTAGNLDSILKARSRYLKVICHLLESGMPVEEINKFTLTQYRQAQDLASESKKPFETNTFFSSKINQNIPLEVASAPQIEV